MRQNIVEKGRVAAGLMIDALNGRGAPGETVIPMQLVERDSVRRLTEGGEDI